MPPEQTGSWRAGEAEAHAGPAKADSAGERSGVLQIAPWSRAMLLTIGIAASTGISVLTGEALGYTPRQAVIFSLPLGAVVGFLLALLLILIPEWRAAADRRWLIDRLADVSKVDREQRFAALLSHPENHELAQLARAIHSALSAAHKDRLEAAHLRRELDARVTRRTRAIVAELNRLSSTDELTGLLNRRGFDAAYAELFDTSGASGDELALLAVDLDLFKQLNDACGHQVGDQALKAVGEVMMTQLREGDLAGRIGGDEFVIALRGTGPAQALAVARRLIDLFSRSPYAVGLPAPWPTLSIGIACAGTHKADSADHLRKLADEALYTAKRAGRNSAVIYRQQDSPPQPAQARAA